MRDKLKEFKRMDTVQSGENVYSTLQYSVLKSSYFRNWCFGGMLQYLFVVI